MHSGNHQIMIAQGPGLGCTTLSPSDSAVRQYFCYYGFIGFFFGHLSACVVEQLETAGFFSDDIPKSRLFVTVHDAVLHILHKEGHTEYELVSKSVIFMLKFRFSVVIVVKSSLLIVGYDLHHPDVASRGQAAIFFVLQLLDALLLSIGLHPCLLPPSEENAPHWHGGRLPWEQEPLLWKQGFYDTSDDPASNTSLQSSPAMVYVRQRRGEGGVGECNTGLLKSIYRKQVEGSGGLVWEVQWV